MIALEEIAVSSIDMINQGFEKSSFFSWNEVSRQTGVSNATISNWRNFLAVPNDSLARRIAQALHIDFETMRPLLEQERYQLANNRLKNKFRDVVKTANLRERSLEHLRAVSGSVDDLIRIPILGEVPGGPPRYTDPTTIDQAEGEIGIPSDIAAGDNLFALRMSGDSMAGKLNDGDLAVIDPDQQPESGEMALVRIGNEATIKQVEFLNDSVILRSSDGDIEPILIKNDDTRDIVIEGRVVMRITRY